MAQNALSESEANLKAIFENTNHIIGLFDKDLRLVEYNQAFVEYAYFTDKLKLEKGMHILEKMSRPQATAFKAFLAKSLKGEKHSEIVEYPIPNGGMLYFMLSYNPILKDQEVLGVSMFVQDITELKLAQKSLENYSSKLEELVEERTLKLHNANQELQETNDTLLEKSRQLQKTLDHLQKTQTQLIQSEKMASLGVLAAGVGHEINNPLNFIKGGVSGMRSQLIKKDPELEGIIAPFNKIIEEGINRASAIVKSLSNFSRQGDGTQEDCQLHDILENCLVMLRNKLKYKVEIVKNFHSEPISLRGNGGKLHQVFLNILANAEQAITEKGEITLTTKLEKEICTIEIGDNGCGIPEENLKKISDPFFTTKPPGEGTGLGLSITYQIIQEHQGKIEVRSTEGKGTVFRVKLPASNSVN